MGAVVSRLADSDNQWGPMWCAGNCGALVPGPTEFLVGQKDTVSRERRLRAREETADVDTCTPTLPSTDGDGRSIKGERRRVQALFWARQHPTRRKR